ncbi:inositol monophosphatase family protein [Pseudocnuella soli]|uniref:inositol monophosphatase family protein n=1 Tax=Pseudocnuella soli TaxID=2502779 RepID=UPI0010500CAE|nr:inositol monophosphatase family protein [Pseudocnuella soli]
MHKQTLLTAIEAAAAVIRRFDDIAFDIASKDGRNDLVTEVDHASEKAIIETIRAQFPDHHILTEESGDLPQASEYKWIIDPIDGTINFAHRIPICAVSIGLEYQGQMVLGAVYNPFMNEMFLAERGQGATFNGKPIQVSKKERVENACLVTGFPYTYLDQPNGPLQVFERFIRRGIPVRRLGSAALDLCWVACGRFDGFYEHSLKPWDSAAGYLMVQEAGGIVTNIHGEPYSVYEPGIIAANDIMHGDLVKWVKGEVGSL